MFRVGQENEGERVRSTGRESGLEFLQTCSKCKEAKEEIEFYTRKDGGTNLVCRSCVSARNKIYRLKNLEKRRQHSKEYCRTHAAERSAKTKIWAAANRDRRRDTQYRLFYGITLARFEELNRQQNGACAICGTVPNKPLYVDHCHVTKVVRGLLCCKCNFFIGLAQNNPTVLSAAIRYLEGNDVISSEKHDAVDKA